MRRLARHSLQGDDGHGQQRNDVIFNLVVKSKLINTYHKARVAELVDALDLGSSSRKGVGVRVPSLAP